MNARDRLLADIRERRIQGEAATDIRSVLTQLEVATAARDAILNDLGELCNYADHVGDTGIPITKARALIEWHKTDAR